MSDNTYSCFSAKICPLFVVARFASISVLQYCSSALPVGRPVGRSVGRGVLCSALAMTWLFVREAKGGGGG